MSEFLDKISSYNIFNYLMPGRVIRVFLVSRSLYSTSLPNDAFTIAFVFYFYGLLISRTGSLLVEPTLKKLGVLVFADYKLFVMASKTDPKLEVLSEQNNTYRSLISMSIYLFVLKIYEELVISFPDLATPALYSLAAADFSSSGFCLIENKQLTLLNVLRLQINNRNLMEYQ